MRTTMRGRAARGFALVEVVAVVVVIGLLAAVLAVSAGESRRLARLGEDIAKLRQIGAWTGSYAADNSDQFWTFSWKKGQSLSQYPDLNNAGNDLHAAEFQAVDILRRLADRPDMPLMGAWFPHYMYSHLPLQEHLRTNFPDPTFISAADRRRLQWSRNPRGFDAGLYMPAPTGVPTDPTTKRWPYSASFQLPCSFYDQSSVGLRIYQSGTHNTWNVPNGSLGPRVLADAAFPSQKVHVHDGVAWHFGPRVSHFAFSELRLPLLFVDGHVQVRASGDANPGWNPNTPTSSSSMSYNYSPVSTGGWEPPTLAGTPSELVPAGRFRWTRGGIAGRDFDGPEVCTGQPGCP